MINKLSKIGYSVQNRALYTMSGFPFACIIYVCSKLIGISFYVFRRNPVSLDIKPIVV